MEVREPSARCLALTPRKRTELGDLPIDWQVTRLSEIATVTSGKRLPVGQSLTTSETPHPYIRVSDMRHGTVDSTAIQFVPVDVFPKIQQYRIFSTDLYISVAGTLGLVGQIPSALDGANLTENANRISGIRDSKSYLYQVLASPLVQSVIESERTVGAQPKLALGRIRNFYIPLPPSSEEQFAIGKALADADALIDSLEQLLTKKRQIKQGAMQELLTGKRRLPGFVAEYRKMSLRALLSQPATYGIVTAGAFVQRGVQMVRGGDISDGKIQTDLPMVTRAKANEYARTTLRQGDVVIALVGYPGEAALVPNELADANISRAVGLLRPNSEIDGGFLAHLLNSPEGRRMVLAPSAGSAQLVVNLAALNKLELAVPPMPEQHAIASVLSDMDTEITALEARLSKARALKQAMAQALLTGRIRLVEPTA